MIGQSLLADLLQTISDRGRGLVESLRWQEKVAEKDFAALCGLLLSGQGEASGLALAQDILALWLNASDDQKLVYLTALAEQFGPDQARLDAAVETYRATRSPEAAAQLHLAAEPKRQELIRRLNMAPGATSHILEMRAHVLKLMGSHPQLARVDADLHHLAASWFNRGFLVLRQIDWTTSASILEKIIRYEAVHTIGSWEDLRERLEPGDRRCFAFFHPRLSDVPLIFVEVALTRETPATIASVLAERRAETPPRETTTAVFYSITNCQVGLRGVSFGNFLLKQAIEALRAEMPNLTDFVTLSPVPGLVAWLQSERESEASEAIATLLAVPDWLSDAKKTEEARKILLPLAARYFVKERDRRGQPLDPVARFHLGNGARLERLNFLGDMSPKAIRESLGLMVNYRYRLDELEKNHELFAAHGVVATTPAIQQSAETQPPHRDRSGAARALSIPAAKRLPR